MSLFIQASNGVLTTRRLPFSNLPTKSSLPKFSSPYSSLHPKKPLTNFNLATTRRLSPSASLDDTTNDNTVFVGEQGVPLEGVIQFDKPPTPPSRLLSWLQVGLLCGGDVLCLLLFAAVGRFTHGFPVLDIETLRVADPFIAGWVLSAYFLGGYGDDGKGVNGSNNAIVAAAKSWAVGIPLGILIRTTTAGHIPQVPFMLVTMGSTGILLIGWRALASTFLPIKQSKKSDVYRRGSAFELFELLTSLIRRW